MPQGIDPLLLLVFSKLYTKDSRRLFLEESTRWCPGPWGSSWLLKKSMTWAPLSLPSMVVTPPGLLLHVGQRMNHKSFLSSLSNEGFSQNSSSSQGKGGRFYSFPVYTEPFGITVFPKFLSGGGCVIEPAIPRSLSTPSCPPGGGHYPPGASLGSLLKVPQQIGFLLEKEAWLKNVKYGFINKVLPCDEVAILAQRDAQNWIWMRATCLC